MDKLTQYLINNAEAFIGSPIKPTEEVLAREDAPLYIWYKMGMSHQLMCDKDPMGGKGWESLAPAAHLYVLNKEELSVIKPFLDKAYIELKNVLGSLDGDLWYLLNMEDGWHLYKGSEDFGTVDIDKETEVVADADAAVSNLLVHLFKDFPKMCILSKCIVLPYGELDTNVWEYANKVVLLGSEEANDFVSGVVTAHAESSETKKIIPRW